MSAPKPFRRPPTTDSLVRASLLWIGGTAVGLLFIFLFVMPIAETLGVSDPTTIGKVLAFALSALCIVKIRSIWRRSQ